MTRSLVILIALALVPLASGSPSVPPQDDGGSGDDASNFCSGALVELEVDGDALAGELHPPQDSKDYYKLIVDADDVGQTFTVEVDGHHEMRVDVFLPDCGRSVVPSSPGQSGQGGSWHEHDDGTGHTHCDAAGHAADEGCDTENGSRDAFGQSVTFTPSQEGTYYALVETAPNAERGGGPPGKRVPPGDGFTIQNCHLSCMSYTLLSSTDTSTQID